SKTRTGNTIASSTSCKPRSSRLKEDIFRIRSRDIVEALSVEHRFYNWRTRIGRSARVVKAATDDDAGTNVFSLDVTTVAATDFGSEEEGTKMVDLHGSAAIPNVAYLHNWKQHHTSA